MFYDNLKSVCENKGLKMTPIVNECGGAKGSISNWKRGASPNSDIVGKLAVCLNVSTDLLIFGEERNKTDTENKIKFENNREKELLRLFRILSNDEQLKIIGRMELLAEQSNFEEAVD